MTKILDTYHEGAIEKTGLDEQGQCSLHLRSARGTSQTGYDETTVLLIIETHGESVSMETLMIGKQVKLTRCGRQ